jgi:queuine tRNA-ribosyltransferase
LLLVIQTGKLKMSLKFDLLHTDNGARRGVVHTAHGDFQTPAFMAVGTAATVKALTMDMVKDTGTEVILGNTYHLMLRPGGDLVADFGGLHKFSGWHEPILTDSGGFQVMSLSNLVKMREEGVEFTSHIDGGIKHFLTPEKSVQIQHQLDSNITMVLDQCLHIPANRADVEKNVELVSRWAARSKAAFINRDGYGIFGIVQGADFADLRTKSAADLVAMDFDGYAVGGLAVGEPQDVMFDMLSHTTPLLPADKPRYLMGVGTPLDILGAVARGIDMFDCVMPTRAGRTAQAFTEYGTINLRNAKFRDDHTILGKTGLTLGYIHHLVKANEILGSIVLTAHNLTFYQDLMSQIRASISAGNFVKFKQEFMEKYNGKKD